MSPLKWTCKSTREISSQISRKGIIISHTTVKNILNDLGYSLQANEKSLNSQSHPDRNDQFEYINQKVKYYLKKNQPVISVDTKKKEYLGNFANKGREWRPRKNPRRVEDHDFPTKSNGQAIPYGVYDISENLGWVNVGKDNDTATFAAQSIYRWWLYMGRKIYKDAEKILICTNCVGSNGNR